MGAAAPPSATASAAAVAAAQPTGQGAAPEEASKTLREPLTTFTEDQLAFATNGFAASNLIGRGGYAQVYKGLLPGEGRRVAVKRIMRTAGNGRKGGRNEKTAAAAAAAATTAAAAGGNDGGAAREGGLAGEENGDGNCNKAGGRKVGEISEEVFMREVGIVSAMAGSRHVVQLIGYCSAGDLRALVYELLPNGSLERNLHSRTRAALTWRKRARLAVGAARALEHMHSVAGDGKKAVHCDVKAGNILVDGRWEAKVRGDCRGWEREGHPLQGGVGPWGAILQNESTCLGIKFNRLRGLLCNLWLVCNKASHDRV